MANIKEVLIQEQERLEKILRQTRERMTDAPEGSLRVSCSNHFVQYYHCFPGTRKNGEYIPKMNMDLARRLAQKSYDEKILKLVQRRLAQIKKITKDYDNEEIEKIFLAECSQRQKLIRPAEPTWEQRMQKWLKEDYPQKEFQENTPVILTERGERVRSKSEKILADFFFRHGIEYKYERPLYLNHFGIVHPDFTFLSPKLKKEIYWEHHGRMDDPSYAENAIRKLLAYEENGIYPGERLILTFETEKTVLSTHLIKKLVERYLK